MTFYSIAILQETDQRALHKRLRCDDSRISSRIRRSSSSSFINWVGL